MKDKEWTIKDKLKLQASFYNKTDKELMELFPIRTWIGIYSYAITIGLRGRKHKELNN